MLDAGLAVPIALITAAVFVVAGVMYARRGRGGVEDYLVARNSAGSTLATATLVASVAGAWILFNPAQAGTWAGVAAIVGYGIGQAAPLIAFVWIGPKMRSVMPEGHSLTEFVWYRYGPAMYVFTLGVIIFYMFVFLSAELTGISKALNLLADVPLLLTALIVGLLTVGYTAYGGIRASIFTDGIQFVLVIPLLLITFIGLVGRCRRVWRSVRAGQRDRPAAPVLHQQGQRRLRHHSDNRRPCGQYVPSRVLAAGLHQQG